MTYEIIFTDKALRQLKKLEKDVQARIISALNRIKIRPESYLKKLTGDPGYRFPGDEHHHYHDIFDDSEKCHAR